MSLYNQILDVADDLDKSLLREILKESPPPEMVKQANIATRDVQEKLTRDNFALTVLTKEGSELRKYPVNDAANTWLSCQYFEKTAHKLPPKAQDIAAGLLKRACALYNLKETPKLEKAAVQTLKVYNEIYDFKKTAQAVTVEAIVQDDSKHFYALQNRYAMPSPEYVKKAEAYFIDYEKEFSDAADRHEFAANVMARAAELKVPLEHAKTLRKYAGEGYGDILDTQIRMRQDLLQAKPEMSAALEKVASYRKELVPVEFAKLLHAFDKKASLERHYNSYLADAFKSTFEQRITKQASGYCWESDDGSLSLNEKELDSAFDKKYDKVKGYFGETLANQLKKHGYSIFDSLPKDAKETLAKIAKGDI